MFCENDSEKTFQITDTDLNFSAVYNKDYFPQKFSDSIRMANVLLIPYEGFRDKKGFYFPESTTEFYGFLNKQPSIKAEICIDDDEYKKLELHSEIIYITYLIVQFVILPTVTSLVASFLYDKVKSMNRETKDADVNIHIIVDKDGEAKEIKYTGSVEGFEETMQTIEKTLFK